MPFDIDQVDGPVREAVVNLNRMNIRTNSSEGGGAPDHGAPDFAYVEARLSGVNLAICQKNRFLLDKVFSPSENGARLFYGSAVSYGRKTGYYVIGMKRRNLSDQEVKERFSRIIRKLRIQDS